MRGLYHLKSLSGDSGGERRNSDRIGTGGVGAWVAEIVPHEYPLIVSISQNGDI
jgi:hypothetical protein